MKTYNKILLILIILIFSILIVPEKEVQSYYQIPITDSIEWQSCKNITLSFMFWNDPNALEGFYNVCGQVLYLQH